MNGNHLTLLAVAMGLALVPTTASAEHFLCDATQASTNELPVLAQSCPIGDGMWGNRAAKGSNSVFWLQCGILDQALSLEGAKPLYANISTNVWLKPYKNGYRCLIGPYTDLSVAKTELTSIKRMSRYSDAFIREVERHKAPHSNATSKSKTKPPAAAKMPAQQSVTKPVKKMMAQPDPVANEPNSDQPKVRRTLKTPPKAGQVATPTQSDSRIEIRRTAAIAGLDFTVPFWTDTKEQFYMEHKLPWNRVDFGKAKSVCTKLSMRLPNNADWQTLLDAKLMNQDNWPMHLPYWGEGMQGLFTSGKVVKLNGDSLLNVMCVK